MSPGPAKKTLLFLHVPKAAGSSFAGSLANRFAATECLSMYYGDDPGDAALNDARYVFGHLPMSILERFDRPPYTVTIVRDPVERALSTYSYFRALNPEDEPAAVRLDRGLERRNEAVRLAKRCSMEEFIRLAPDLAQHYFGNWQARMLGGKDLDRTDERLEDALDGMERCNFVGLAERLDESVAWLACRLGWAELGPLPLTNVSSARLRREHLTAPALEALPELTSVDRELYARAVRLYQRRLIEWRASAAVKDDSAEIDDARPVSDLRFGEAIRGSGWLGRERIDDRRHFCWIGHTATARVDLADDRAARSVVVEIAHVLDPAILGTLRITVNGNHVPHRLAESGGAVIASAPLEHRHGRRRPLVRVKLAVDHATRPCDVNPTTSDNRELGIAVQRIALTRSAA